MACNSRSALSRSFSISESVADDEVESSVVDGVAGVDADDFDDRTILSSSKSVSKSSSTKRESDWMKEIAVIERSIARVKVILKMTVSWRIFCLFCCVCCW